MLPVFGLLFFIASLATLYYWIRGLMIMSKDSVIWTIAGIFVAPIIQIVFYFTKKSSLDPKEQKMFVLYFILQVVWVALTIGLLVSMASALPDQPY